MAPTGQQLFDRFSIEWKSESVAEFRETISPAGGLGIYQVSLYNVKVNVTDRAGRAWFDFPLKLAGYKQVRNPPKSSPL